MYIHVYPPPGLVVDRVDIEHLDVDSEWPGGKGFPHFTQYISRRFPVYPSHSVRCAPCTPHSTFHNTFYILLLTRYSSDAVPLYTGNPIHCKPYTPRSRVSTQATLCRTLAAIQMRALQTPHFALQTLDPTTLRAPHCRLCPARYIHSPLHTQGSKLHTSHATLQNCSFLKQALLQTPHSHPTLQISPIEGWGGLF